MSALGQLAYQLWFRPVSAVRESFRHGGPLARRRHRRGQRQMQAAARTLPAVATVANADAPPLKVHLLTGENFAYQTVFCLHTLSRHIGCQLLPEIYDDGSLSVSWRDLLKDKFPAVTIHDHATLRDNLDSSLPAGRYPTLRDRWLHYPHIRKLIDVHLHNPAMKLVLDSDILFWRRPQMLLDWSRGPRGPLHAVDCEENYGYARETLQRIAGTCVPALVNVGMIGLHSGELDWDFLEYVSTRLIRECGTSYYLEQALSALVVARSSGPVTVAPASDYRTFPDEAEVHHPTAVMHHYVDLSRDYYHTHAWSLALRTPSDV